MQHECRITVLETKCFEEDQSRYLADPRPGPCPCFNTGDTFLLTALQGGSIMHGWTNDGTRPVIFKGGM